MDKKTMDLVTRLETRTRQLLIQYGELMEEMDRLQKLLAQTQEQNQKLHALNRELQEKYAHLKVAKYIDITDEDKRLSRSRINKMVRDVEKCIAMLKVD